LTDHVKELDLLFRQYINRRMADYNIKQRERERAKKSDYEKGLMDGGDRYHFHNVARLREAGERYNLLKNKKNKSEYERGYFEALKLYLSEHSEEYHLRGLLKHEGQKVIMEPLPPVDFENIKQPQGAPQEPAQELVSANRGRRKKKVNIDWTEEEDKLIYSAVKKYTRDFTSLPAGYSREDVLQEAAQTWAKRLIEKGGHDPAKGKKSTLLYKVVENKIQDLIKAANTDKRKIAQHCNTELKEEAWFQMMTDLNAGDRNITEQYEGGESKKNIGKGDFEPTKRGVKDGIRWRREQEKSGDDFTGQESE
jgi:hypothetical protein